jgi:predicted aspartyl protease
MKIIVCTLCALLAATTSYAADSRPCQLIEAASLAMSVAPSGRLYVPMTVEGKSINMMIDTGNIGSMLTNDAAKKLDLHPLQFALSRIQMYGGKKVDYYVDARNVSLGGLNTDKMRFMILPGDDVHEDNIDGILGPDILQSYDADFDFANSKLNLFSLDHCDGGVVYWTREPVAVVPTTLDEVNHTQLTVSLDGKDIDGIIDTGSQRTLVDWDMVKSQFGINENSPGVVSHKDGDEVYYTYPFKALNFGGIAITNPDLMLVPGAESHTRTHIIVGVSILRHLHFYMANRERKLYITAASAH